MMALRLSFICALVLAASIHLPAPFASLTSARAEDQKVVADLAELFNRFPGRWVGEARIVSKGGKVEKAKCRVTYFLSDDNVELKQNIRCASSGGKIELKSLIKRDGDKITGTWKETIYEFDGDLTGRAIRNGVMAHVKGNNIQATMQLLFVKGKQVVELHFNHETLLGITLVLTKG